MQQSSSFSLYFHIPFCRRRCSYCVFNTYAGLDKLIPAYIDSLCKETAWAGRANGQHEVHTIYIGGGTPSVLSVDQIGSILNTVSDSFVVADNAEISIEVNPTTANLSFLNGIHQVGVNRLSIGAQSALDADLRLFRREHSWSDVIDTVRNARQVGFESISLDLIYGIPGQTLAGWLYTIQQTLALSPQHISMYSLGVEPGSALYNWIQKGEVPSPDSDLAADMYEAADVALFDAGFEQYEISNWAQPGYECQHNMQYWICEPYLGFGAGAHGYTGGLRYAIVQSPHEYIERIKALNVSDNGFDLLLSPTVVEDSIQHVDAHNARSDAMILGLRLPQHGVSRKAFVERFGMTIESCYGKELAELQTLGLIEILDDRVVLTPHARLLGNVVFSYFV